MILVNDQKEAKQKNLKKEDQNPSVGINPDRTIKHPGKITNLIKTSNLTDPKSKRIHQNPVKC